MRSSPRVPTVLASAVLVAVALLEWAIPARALAPSRLLRPDPAGGGAPLAGAVHADDQTDAGLDAAADERLAAVVSVEAGSAPRPDFSQPAVDPWVAGLRTRLAAAGSAVTPEPASAEEPRAPRSAPLRVAIISDLNSSYGSTDYTDDVHAAIERIVWLRPDLVLNTGDMVAGQRRGLDYAGMWAGFHAAVTDPLTAAGIPMAMTPGNHDASGHALFGAERAEYGRQWHTRRPELTYVDDTHYPFRYTFTAGPAFFVSLDATGVGALDAEQMAWLDAQLASAAEWPVRVVFGHVPLYAFSKEKHDEIIGDPALEALLSRHGVDLVVSGHHHTYYPGRRGDLRLVGTSCLGTGLRHLLGSDERSPRSFVLLEIDESGVVELDAFAGADFDERVERATLPESVGTQHRIWRDDVLPAR